MQELLHERGQMYVELAVIIPVLLVLLVISLNLFWYMHAQIVFDGVVLNQVIAKSVSPSAGINTQDVEREIERAMREHLQSCKRVDVRVYSKSAGKRISGDAQFSLAPHFRTYTVELLYQPYPSNFELAGIQAGIPALVAHKKSITVDPYQSGVIF